MWSYHDKQIKRLKQVYNKASKQTQNRIQELIDTFNFNFDSKSFVFLYFFSSSKFSIVNFVFNCA